MAFDKWFSFRSKKAAFTNVLGILFFKRFWNHMENVFLPTLNCSVLFLIIAKFPIHYNFMWSIFSRMRSIFRTIHTIFWYPQFDSSFGIGIIFRKKQKFSTLYILAWFWFKMIILLIVPNNVISIGFTFS